mmetsp:Transcript_11813/g.18169  ORF Transcript_11813/g.18169 Transcript_11813/m.18169 type:complete len:222 (+) Transcript_11813:862-1527(+)
MLIISKRNDTAADGAGHWPSFCTQRKPPSWPRCREVIPSDYHPTQLCHHSRVLLLPKPGHVQLLGAPTPGRPAQAASDVRTQHCSGRPQSGKEQVEYQGRLSGVHLAFPLQLVQDGLFHAGPARMGEPWDLDIGRYTPFFIMLLGSCCVEVAARAELGTQKRHYVVVMQMKHVVKMPGGVEKRGFLFHLAIGTSPHYVQFFGMHDNLRWRNPTRSSNSILH